MTEALANILVANPWQSRRQNHPAKSFLRFGFTEALRPFVRQRYCCLTDTSLQLNLVLVLVFKVLRPHPWH